MDTQTFLKNCRSIEVLWKVFGQIRVLRGGALGGVLQRVRSMRSVNKKFCRALSGTDFALAPLHLLKGPFRTENTTTTEKQRITMP